MCEGHHIKDGRTGIRSRVIRNPEGYPMRDPAKQYEGSTFAVEKAVAAIYAAMFLVIIGMGLLDRARQFDPEPTALASVEITAP